VKLPLPLERPLAFLDLETTGPADATKAFKRDFFRDVSKGINAIRGRHGKVFHRRASDIPVVDDGAEIERIVYTYMNPTEAGLVDDPEDWVGFSTLHESLGGEPRTFAWLDRTAYNRARLRRKDVTKEDFTHYHTLNIVPPQSCADKPDKYIEGAFPKSRYGYLIPNPKPLHPVLRLEYRG